MEKRLDANVGYNHSTSEPRTCGVRNMWGPGGSYVPSEHQEVSRSLVGWHQRQEGRLWYWARSDHPWHRHGSNHILLPQQPWSATIHIPHRCCKINHTQNLTAIQNFYPVSTSKLIEAYNGYMDSAIKSAISSNILTSFLCAIIYHRLEHEIIGYNKGILAAITADEIKLIKHPEVSNSTALLDTIPALPTLRSWRTRWKVTQ